MKMKKMTLATAAFAVFLTGTGMMAYAEEAEAPYAELDVSLLSKYVWRGFELSKDSIVIQPSLTVGYKGFGVNLWGNLDTDQDPSFFDSDGTNWNETNLTLSYDNSFDMVSYGFGYLYYALDGIDDDHELYAYAELDTILVPTLTIYRNFDDFRGWYIELSVSHSFEITETISLDLGGHVSYLAIDDADVMADPNDETSAYSNFHDGLISISSGIPIGEYFTVTPEIYYSFPLSSDASDVITEASFDGDEDDFIYGGVTLSMAF